MLRCARTGAGQRIAGTWAGLVVACLAGGSVGVALGQEPGAPAARYRIAYATYVGGSADEQLREVIPQADGSVLVGGQTSSPDLPITPGAFQPKYAGEPAGTGHPGVHGGDCFLMYLSADGAKVLACTYFGGSRQERNTYGMEQDANGDVVIASATRSPDLPTTRRAFQPRYGGGASDWVVAKLSADLKRLLWCTYVGGGGDDSPRGGIALGADGSVYVVGGSDSPDFPTTEGVVQRERRARDACIARLKADGSGLVFATRLGGSDWDGTMGIRVAADGTVYVAGHTQSADFPITAGAAGRRFGAKADCYLAALSGGAERLIYATFLGGQDSEFAEHRPLLLADGSVLLTGVTSSSDFPTTPGAFQRQRKGRNDGFLTKLSPDGKSWAFSTLLGGSEGEFLLMPTPGPDGSILLVGTTGSADFPITPDAVQRTYGGGPGDGVLAILSPDGSKLLYATFLGGEGDDLIRSLAVTPAGEIYLVGSTSSKDLPVTAGALGPRLRGRSDAFVVKLVPVR